MKKLLSTALAAGLTLYLLTPQPGWAKAPEAPAAEQLLQLFEAYQGGYLQVVAVACFQLYYSTGIIATDVANSSIDGETALYALQKNSLLNSTCVTTLAQIFELTPEADTSARGELKRLWDILILEDTLSRALADSLGSDDPALVAAVDKARADVEQALEAYTAGMAQ